jgi:hypothetical protein
MEDVLREGQVMEGVFQAFQSYENIVLKHTKISPLTGVDVFGRIMLPVCRNNIMSSLQTQLPFVKASRIKRLLRACESFLSL